MSRPVSGARSPFVDRRLLRSLRTSALVLAVAVVPATAQQRPAGDSTLPRADAAWDAKDLATARALYGRVVGADSTASSRAVYRLAVLLSWDDQLAEAIRLHRLYVRLEPRDLEGRVGLARVYAWAARFPASVATYDTVLAREADYRDAALGRAQALGWWGHFNDAIAAYRAWRQRHPDDVEAALAHARTLAWKGALTASEALYDSLGATGGAEAEKGVARVQAWRGDLGRSEIAWTKLTVKYPTDPETWTGLAQVQRWQGRPFAARVSLTEALRVRPGFDDARQQLRWVNAEVRPQLSVSLLRAEDSEKNRLDAVRVGYGVSSAWGGRWSVGAEQKRAGREVVAQATTLRGGLLWELTRLRASLRGELGLARLDTGGAAIGTRDVLVGGLRYFTAIGDRLSAGVGVERVPFDEVRSTISRGIVFSSFDVDASLQLATHLTLAVAIGTGRTAGTLDTARTRTSALARARWTVRHGAALVATARTYAWDHPAYSVFFAPQRFVLTELGGEWGRTGDLGLVLSGAAGIGRQSVRFEGDAAVQSTAPRASLITGWRFAPGREVTATFTYANVGTAPTLRPGDYWYSGVLVAGRFTF